MNKFFKLIFLCLVSFTLTYLIIDYGINRYNEQYIINIDVEHSFLDEILTEEYWISVQESSITYEDIEIEKVFSSMIFDNETGELIVEAKYFNTYSIANSFLKKINNLNLTSDSIYYISSSVDVINDLNSFLISFVVSLIITFAFSCIIKNRDNDLYDYKNLYPHPFNINYWRTANKEMKSVKNLVLMSILIALQVIAHLITLPSGFGDLGLSLGYLFIAINCMFFGPVNGLIIGFIGDNIGYLIAPTGTYFFGYTLSAMLAAFVYGLCFYKTKISFTKVLISRFIVNLLINVLLGTLWIAIMYGFTFEQALNSLIYIYLPKNIFYLIPQSIVLFLVLKYTIPVFCAHGYLDERIKENITIL